MPLNVVLYQPEIPPNTGNIMRLCANTGAILHIIHPMGFTLDDKRMRRAGLDYHEWANVMHYQHEQEFLEKHKQARVFALTTKTSTRYDSIQFENDDFLMFGPETRGLPARLREQFIPLTIPMVENSRSLNLSNSVAVVLYEAWRQLGFSRL